MSIWDSIGGNNNGQVPLRSQNNNFNIQEFLKFYNENKNKDMNSVLQNMINNGQATQEQVNEATSQAQGILQMLQGLGLL